MIRAKHLEREQLEELYSILDEYDSEHELTEWLRYVLCMNDGDSTIHACSALGHKVLQWHLDEWDEEDEENYRLWWTDDDDEPEWDFDDDEEE